MQCPRVTRQRHLLLTTIESSRGNNERRGRPSVPRRGRPGRVALCCAALTLACHGGRNGAGSGAGDAADSDGVGVDGTGVDSAGHSGLEGSADGSTGVTRDSGSGDGGGGEAGTGGTGDGDTGDTGEVKMPPCTHHLDPAGADDGSGSMSAPWRTINHASAQLEPGDVLCARGGTYYGQSGHIWHSSGTAAAPIIFQNYPGETPIFDGEWGDTGAAGEFLNLSDTSWLVIDGITAQHYDDQFGNGAINMHAGQGPVSNIVIQNCTLQDNGRELTRDHHIYLGEGATNITVRNNLLVRAAGGAVHAYHTPGPTGIEIYNNVIVGGTLSCTRIERNPCAAGSTSLWGLIMADANHVQIYNNTIYGMQRGIDFSYTSDPGAIAGPYVVQNNLIVNSAEFGLRVDSAYAPYFSSDYNGFYSNGTDILWDDSAWTLAQFVTNTPHEDHGLAEDPSFVAAGSDFHLNGGSPVIDKGATLDLFDWDKDWRPRPQGTAYDLGAYEQ